MQHNSYHVKKKSRMCVYVYVYTYIHIHPEKILEVKNPNCEPGGERDLVQIQPLALCDHVTLSQVISLFLFSSIVKGV